eukprot:UN33561
MQMERTVQQNANHILAGFNQVNKKLERYQSITNDNIQEHKEVVDELLTEYMNSLTDKIDAETKKIEDIIQNIEADFPENVKKEIFKSELLKTLRDDLNKIQENVPEIEELLDTPLQTNYAWKINPTCSMYYTSFHEKLTSFFGQHPRTPLTMLQPTHRAGDCYALDMRSSESCSLLIELSVPVENSYFQLYHHRGT